MGAIRIGVLEFGDLTLSAVLSCAQLADRFGYSRYWLAEHVGGDRVTGGRPYTNSLLMVPLVAGVTEQIRVGPAGVLLRYFAAAAVARDAAFLERVFGRVDLGLAAGRIPSPWDAMFRDGRNDVDSNEYFDTKAAEVARWIDENVPSADRPPVWVHTSSGAPDRVAKATQLGANLAVSLFHPPRPPHDVARAFRDASASRGRDARAVVALSLACIESERERAAFRSAHAVERTFVDTPARCRERIADVADTYAVDEVIVLESSVGIERRLASLQFIAEAFGADGRECRTP
jgi:alkanesulfonate monooxygenase SsuD/methylene tetrahydromethanopterin reductase-like flavin-dependent oxidoreductase (luciferase family)